MDNIGNSLDLNTLVLDIIIADKLGSAFAWSKSAAFGRRVDAVSLRFYKSDYPLKLRKSSMSTSYIFV